MLNDVKEEIKKITTWIKQYVENSGAKGIVIGNSGGKDSATVIALCTKAIGSENIVTVAMPCSSITADLEDARLVAKTFNVPMAEIDLTETYNVWEYNINKQIFKANVADEISNESKVNVKPRLRMLTLYSIAQTRNYLVAGTGNASEAFVGYTTKWGDSACDFNPIASFTVEEVLQIGEYLGVPEKIIKKAPNDGLGTGTDEQKMGVTYKQITEYMKIGRTEENAMKIIKRLHENSEHKRVQIPIYKK